MTIQLVLFDMDGVIFEGKNFWLDLHKAFGTVKQGLELADKYLTSDYEFLARTTAADLWKDKPVSIYRRLLKERAYQPGVQEVFKYLRHHHIATAIISSGPYHLALRAKRELGIDEIWANRLLIDGNKFKGEVDLRVSDSAKQQIGALIMERRGVTAEQTAFVGDSEADVTLTSIVGLPIAYDSTSTRLTRSCRHVLKYGELAHLIKIIAAQNG
jgi:phosphoserine phosphatase